MSDNLMEFYVCPTKSIVPVVMYLNQQIDSQKCVVISHWKYTAYKNKSVINYDAEH